MNASTLSFRAATIFAVAGISMGIAMAVMRDHAIMPAHAHLNLLGWVSLFLFGIYYRLNPSLDSSRLALVQVSVWSLGTIVLTVAVAALHLGQTQFDSVAAISSIVLLADMLLFAALVFRPTLGVNRSGAAPLLTPAE
jgi:hypothetical protein